MDTDEIRRQVTVGANENILSAAQIGSTKYEIVDSDARVGVAANANLIDQLSGMIQGGVHYIGKTTTALTDGSTTNPIDIITDPTANPVTTKSVTAVQGDMVSMAKDGSQDLEFIFNGTAWYEIGSTGSLKALAFKDKAEGTYTPAGSVSVSATTIGDLSVTYTSADFNEVSVAATVAIDKYTPEGSVSIDEYTPSGSVSVNNIVVGDKKITVKEISSQAFEGSAVTTTVSATTQSFALPTGITFGQVTGVTGTVVGTEATISTVLTATTGDVESTGTLSKLPELSSAGTVNTVTAVSTTSAVAGSATVVDGVLSFSFADVLTAATVTTSNVDVNVSAGYKASLTDVTALDLSVTGTAVTSVTPGSTTYTPAGSVNVDTFSPSGSLQTTSTTLTASGNTGNIIAAGTVKIGIQDVEKTVSIGTLSTTASFSGTAATLNANFEGTEATPTGTVTTTKFTPVLSSFVGKVTVPSHTHDAGFSGTSATIEVF